MNTICMAGNHSQTQGYMNTPLISVCVQTYQHAGYISKCLDSILMQETEFPFEIVLGEDESSDGTREICIAYHERHPDRIRLFLRRREDVIYIGGRPSGRFNMLENMRMAKGKYIALCEGDDFWIDSLKLQKQFDYLEKESTCSAVFSDIMLVDSQGKFMNESRRVPTGLNRLYTYHLMQGNAIHTANIFFRRELLDSKAVDFIRRMPYGDMSLYLICSLSGPIGYIPEITSAYRVNVGVMRKVGKAQRARNSMFIRKSFMNEYVDDSDLQRQYNVGVKKYYLDLSSGEFRKGQFIAGFKAYLLFWWSTIYRIFPTYPILKRIGFVHHFQPLREFLAFLKRQLKARMKDHLI